MLNIWKISYLPKRRIIDNLKILWRKHKWAFQRMYHGFSDYDVWDLNHYLTDLLAATLNHLANTTHGYPGYGEFDSPEKWENYLRETAKLFETANSDMPNKYENAIEFLHAEANNMDDIYKNKMWQCFFEVEKQNENYKTECLNKALERLIHIYPNLWD